MTDVVVESKAPPEVQAEAEKMGWISPEKFKGDPEKFIDADTYLERGNTVLPIVKAQLAQERNLTQKLYGEVTNLRAAFDETKRKLDEIEERHAVDTAKKIADVRKELTAQLAIASEKGDHLAVAEITEELTRTNVVEDADKETKKAAAAVAAGNGTKSPQQLEYERQCNEWQSQNEWYGKDRRKTALFHGIMQEMRDAGDASIGPEFFNKAKAELEKDTGGRGGVDKVAGGRNGSGDSDTRQSGGSGRRGFAQLPKDAQDACMEDVRNFVGPNKKYKTEGEWQAAFARIYFEQEK